MANTYNYEKCTCGKTKLSEAEAIDRLQRNWVLKRYYGCKLSNTYHVTKLPKWSASSDEREEGRRRMLLRTAVIQYLNELYSDSGTYKVTTNMIREALKGKHDVKYISQTVNNLKHDGVLTNLGERMPPPNQKIVYFALTEVLDRVTNPVFEETNEVASIPKQTTPVANPPLSVISEAFDTIIAKLDGVIKGYTENTKALVNLRESGIAPSTVSIDLDAILASLSAVVLTSAKEIKEAQHHGNVATQLDIGESLKSSTSTLLGAMQADKEVIQRSIEGASELHRSIVDTATNDLYHKLTTTPGSPVSGKSDEYKEGIKDGIRLGIEMKLSIPDGA